MGRSILAAVALAVGAGPACRIFMAAEWERRDLCADDLPILRREPEEEYRVIKIIKAKDEDDLAWRACAENADAVISLGPDGELEARTTAGMVGGTTIVRTRVKRSDFIEGLAIRYLE